MHHRSYIPLKSNAAMKFSPLTLAIIASSCNISETFQVQPKPITFYTALYDKPKTYNTDLGPDDFEMSPEFLSTKSLHNIEKKIKEDESSKRPLQDVSLELKPKMLQKSEKTLEIETYNTDLGSDDFEMSPEFLSTKSLHNIEKKIKEDESSKRPLQDVSLELKPKMLQKSEKTLEIEAYNTDLGSDDFEMSPEFLSTKSLHNIEKKIKEDESSKRPLQDVSLELKPKMLQKSEKTLEIDVDIKPDVKISTKASISKVQGTNAVDNLPQGAISRRYEFISKKPGMRTVTQNEKVRLDMSPSFIRKTTKVEDPPDMTTLNYKESLRKAELNSGKSLNDKSPPVDHTSTLSNDESKTSNDHPSHIDSKSEIVNEATSVNEIQKDMISNSPEIQKLEDNSYKKEKSEQLDDEFELSAQSYGGAFQFRNMNPNMIYFNSQPSLNYKSQFDTKLPDTKKEKKKFQSVKVNVQLNHKLPSKTSPSPKVELGLISSESNELGSVDAEFSPEGKSKDASSPLQDAPYSASAENQIGPEQSIVSLENSSTESYEPKYDDTAWSTSGDQRREQEFIDRSLGLADRTENAQSKRQAGWPNGGNGQPLNQKDREFINRTLQKTLENERRYANDSPIYTSDDKNMQSDSRKQALRQNGGNGEPLQQKDIEFIDRAMGLKGRSGNKREALWPNGGNGQPLQQKDMEFIEKSMGLGKRSINERKEAMWPNGGNGQPLQQKDIEFIEMSMGLGKRNTNERKEAMWPNGGNGQPLQPKDNEFIDKALGLTGENNRFNQSSQSTWPNGGNNQPLEPKDAKFIDKALSRTNMYRQPERREIDASLYGKPITDVQLTPPPIQEPDLVPSKFAEGTGMPLRREIQRKPGMPYDNMDEPPPEPFRRTERPIEVDLQLSSEFKTEGKAPEVHLSLSPDFRKLPRSEEIRLHLSPDRKENIYYLEEGQQEYEEDLDPDEIRYMEMQRELAKSYMPEGFIQEQVVGTNQNNEVNPEPQNNGNEFVLSEGLVQQPDFDGSIQYTKRSMEVHSTGGKIYNFEGYDEKYRKVVSDENPMNGNEALDFGESSENESATGSLLENEAYVYNQSQDVQSSPQFQEPNLEYVSAQSNPYVHEGRIDQSDQSSQYLQPNLEVGESKANEGYIEENETSSQYVETRIVTEINQNNPYFYDGYIEDNNSSLQNEKQSVSMDVHNDNQFIQDGFMDQTYESNQSQSINDDQEIQKKAYNEGTDFEQKLESVTAIDQSTARQQIKLNNPYMYEGFIEQVTQKEEIVKEEMYEEPDYEELDREHIRSYMYEGCVEDLTHSPSSNRIMELSPDRPKVGE